MTPRPPPSTLPEEVRFAASDGLVWRRTGWPEGQPQWWPIHEPHVCFDLLASFSAAPWSYDRAYQLRGAMAAIGLTEQEIAA